MNRINNQFLKKALALTLMLAMLAGMLPTGVRDVKAAENVTLTVESYGRQNDENNQRYLFTISGVSDQNDIYWSNNVVYIDGVAVTQEVHWALAGDNKLYLLVYPASFGKDKITDVTGEHIIHVKSGTTIGSNTSAGAGGKYTIANDLVFKVNGSTIKPYTPIDMQFDYYDGCQDGNTRYLFHMKGFPDAGDVFYNNNKGLIDGDKEATFHINPPADGSALITLAYDQVEEGKTEASKIGSHQFVIPQYTVIGNTGSYITLNEIRLDINGQTISKALAQEVVTLSDRPTSGSTVGTGFYFVTSPEDHQPYDETWKTWIPFSSGGVYVNGELKSKVQLKKVLANLWYVGLSEGDAAVEAGARVTIDGSVKGTDYETVFTSQTFVFTGSEWNIYDGSSDVKFTGIYSGAWYADRDKWFIYLNTDKIVPGTVDKTRFYLRVYVDGQDLGDIGFDKSGGTNNPLFLPFTKDQLSVGEKQREIVVKARNATGTDYATGEKYIVNFVEDFTFYLNPNGTFTTTKVYEGVLSLNQDLENTNINDIKLNTTENIWSDALIASNGWSNENYPLEADDTTGIWVNDTKKLNLYYHYLLKNYSDGKIDLWIRWEQFGMTGPSAGDKITVKGTYYRTEEGCRYVCYETFTVYWTGSHWTTNKVSSVGAGENEIAGDSNGDNMLDSKDIVRIKKYLTTEEAVHTGNADANGSGSIDQKDYIKTIEYILEGYVNDEGQYVQGDVPVYLDDVEITMFAFQGPRTAGATDYNYTPSSTALTSELSGFNRIWSAGGKFDSQSVSKSYLNSTEMTKYKAAGFTRLLPEGDCPWVNSDYFEMGGGMYANMKYYMLLAQDAGLDVIVTSEVINYFLANADSATEGKQTTNLNKENYTVNQEIVAADLQKLVNFMNGDNDLQNMGLDDEYFKANFPSEYISRMQTKVKFDNFIGIQLSDELFHDKTEQQTANLKSKIEYIVTTLRELKPDAVFSGSQTAASISNDNIVSAFGATGSFLYNCYPYSYKLTNRVTSYTRESKNCDTSTWFGNLETSASKVTANGINAGITIQSFAMDNSAAKTAYAPIESSREVSWQIYTALAYGIKEIDYFTYWEHRTQGNTQGEAQGEVHYASMVKYPADPNADGAESVATDVYGYVQEANEEIKKIDHVFMDFDLVNVSRFTGSQTSAAVTDDSGVTFAIEGSSSDITVISKMQDSGKQKNNIGYWLVNATDATGVKSDNTTCRTVTASFGNDVTHVLTWEDGRARLMPITNGTYETELLTGKGVFVIPVKVTK